MPNASDAISAVRAYVRTVQARVFASSRFYDLREMGNEELRQFVLDRREEKLGDVSIAKHLRQLSACFQAPRLPNCPRNPFIHRDGEI